MITKILKRLFRVLPASSGYCLAWMAGLLMIVSCKDTYEWQKFEPAEFDIEGIALTKHDTGFKYTGTIPPEGAKFVITGKGKNVNFVRLEMIGVNDQIIYMRDSSQGLVCIEGEWGEIKERTEKAPFIAEFKITPNTTNEARDFYFEIGQAYIQTEIYFTQSVVND